MKTFNLKKTLARYHNFYGSYGPKYVKNGVFMVERSKKIFELEIGSRAIFQKF